MLTEDRFSIFPDDFSLTPDSHGQHDSGDILLRRGAKFAGDNFGKTPLDLCLEVSLFLNLYNTSTGNVQVYYN